MNTLNINAAFAPLLQQFFLERLLQQRNASAQTVASYRDTFRLLLQFAERQLHKPPERLELTDLDASFVLAFLNHLERERKNSIRSRNARLAAIRSFLHYAALKAPTALPSIQSVLAIPLKRFERPMIGFLSQAEIAAVLNAPDGASWCGQRDRAMLATLYNTGARVSELIGMRVGDVVLERSASVRIHGKGRKERIVPLWRSTAAQIRRWPVANQRDPRSAAVPESLKRAHDPIGRDGSAQARLQTRHRPLSPACGPAHLASHVSTRHRHAHAPGGGRCDADRALPRS